MHARLLREERAALERLDDEVVGDVAREAEVDGRVDQGLHDQEDVGRAGPGDRGRHRDELLVVDLDLRAERAEQRAGLLALRRRTVSGVAYQTVMPAPELGGRVGHAPDDLVVAEGADEGPRRRAGEDADDELARLEPSANLAPDAARASGA